MAAAPQPLWALGSLTLGLGSTITRSRVQAQSSDDAKWKQYAGSKLVFMSENTPPSFAIRDNIKTFFDLTGIEVTILTDDLPVVQQKVGIDLRGGKADYVLNYVQDKPIGAPFGEFYADMTPLFGDATLPQDPDGYGDDAWFENFLSACGRFYKEGKIVALPYDCRRRLHLLSPGSVRGELQGLRGRIRLPPRIHARDSTWKNVIDMAAFFKKAKEAGKDVPYGYAQHQGSFAWTTQLDIQRFLFANGRWMDWNIDDVYGSQDAGQDQLGRRAVDPDDDASSRSWPTCRHPDNLANGTLELNTVYQSGNIAMQMQYHEFAASIEDEKTSRAAGGKTAYAHLPEGRCRAGSRMAARRSTAAIAASAASASTAMPPRI